MVGGKVWQRAFDVPNPFSLIILSLMIQHNTSISDLLYTFKHLNIDKVIALLSVLY